MATTDPATYAVFPTQAWQVCEPETGFQHIQPPAAQGGAALGDYVYLFAPTSAGQFYAQRILIERFGDDPTKPWITYLQGGPAALIDSNGDPVSGQAPPAAVTTGTLVSLVHPGVSGDQRIYLTRFDGTKTDLPRVILAGQTIASDSTPCIALLDQNVFLAWPGGNYDGYYYAVGTLAQADAFGVTIDWGDAKLVPGSQQWVKYGDTGNPMAMAFKTDTASGFVFFTEHFDPSNDLNGLSYFVYDNATRDFTSQTPLPFPWPADNPPGYTVFGCTLPASSKLVIPVLIDQVGNVTYYQLDDSAPNYGTFADWLQCAIGGSGGTVSVAVGIPPSISVGEDLDSSPDPILSAVTVVPGVRGGAVICSQFYDPMFGDNELGYAAVPLNVGKLTLR